MTLFRGSLGLLLCIAVSSTELWANHPASGDRRLSRPSIVWLLADDLGWADLGCYGSAFYETPRIDRLAERGVRFTQAYSGGPNCAPTRACLMTGRYPPRHGIYTVNQGNRGRARFRRLNAPANQTELATEWVTIAERFQQAGYATAHFGKWHLGQPGSTGPQEQGFHENVAGFQAGHPRSYFSPYQNPQLPDGPEGEYLTDRLAAEVCRFLERHADQPFFAYVPFYAVHTPIQAKLEIETKYRDKPPQGGQHRADYAAMIESLDNAVGDILDQLDRLELTDSTIVIFSSDNGGVGGYRDAGIDGGQEITSQAPLRGGKGMLYEGGIRVPLLMSWPQEIAKGRRCHEPVTSVDFYETLCQLAGFQPDVTTDGRDFSDWLRDPTQPLSERALYWHFPGYLEANVGRGTWRTTPAGAIRRGEWKLLEFFEEGRTELYRLSSDPGETRDLSVEFPDVHQALLEQLRQWRQQVQAPMPTANPQFAPAP